MVEKKLAKYYWIGGVVLVTLTVVILAIIFIVGPSFKSIGKVREELKNSKAELKIKEEKLVKLKDLKVKEDEIREQSEVVYRAIPTKKEIGDIFIQLAGLIGEAGGTDKGDKGKSGSSGTSTAKPPEIDGVKTLTYDVETSLPDFAHFKSLLENSEKTLRYVHLDSFTIDNKESFSVKLTYSAYYREQGAGEGESGEK